MKIINDFLKKIRYEQIMIAIFLIAFGLFFFHIFGSSLINLIIVMIINNTFCEIYKIFGGKL